jgi:magnesium-dependent phosphatase 1
MPKKISKAAAAAAAAAAKRPSLSIPASLTERDLPLPKLVVFDLDYTLWPFWIDTHVLPPLKPSPDHAAAFDRRSEAFSFYADVPAILLALPALGVRTAVASRTQAEALARDLLRMLWLVPEGVVEEKAVAKSKQYAWDAFDAGLEMYDRDKVHHFQAIQARTGIAYEDMLFFDDEERNFTTEKLGVTMWLVRDGVTWDEFERGVAEWRKRRARNAAAATADTED